MTKTQQEIVDFTRAEFNKFDPESRERMYEALRLAAKMKWPEIDWGISFLNITSHKYGKKCETVYQ